MPSTEGVHRRVLLVVDPSAPLTPMLLAARRVAPDAEQIAVVVLGSPGTEPLTPRHSEEPLAAVFDALGVGSVETTFDSSQIPAIARNHEVSLVVVGPWPERSYRARALLLVELSSHEGFDVLSVGARCVAAPVSTGHLALRLEPGPTVGPSTAAMRALKPKRVTIFGPASLEQEVPVLLPGVEVNVVPLETGLLDVTEVLEREAVARQVELLVLASSEVSSVRQLVTGLASANQLEEAAVPLLILHRGDEAIFSERLTCTDTLLVHGRESAYAVERTSALGRSTLPPVELIGGLNGESTLPRPPGGEGRGEGREPATSLESPQRFAVTSGALVATARILPARPLVLIDAGYPLDQLHELEPFARDHELAIVRLRADDTLEALRARFATPPWGTPPALLDASAWLDDGGAADIPQTVDGLRLLRLATHLVAGGANIAALVTTDAHALHTDQFITWTPMGLRGRSPLAPLSRHAHAPTDVESRWSWLTGASAVDGHAVRLEFDNREARTRLIAAIDGAKTRVHWQSYIVENDGAATQIADALTRAANRGVEVRVLVDALYSRHDAFGTKNPILERLSSVKNVEVHGIGRLEGMPSLADLKQRNHRKLVVIDGVAATLSGRNLGATYYLGFEDLELSGLSSYRDVPWLDCSLVVDGPLVERMERSFLADWQKTGGSAFPIAPVAPVPGGVTCRFVAHEGLLDGRTLDAQLELINSARERLIIVNTFPLMLEIQRALIRAVQRGVRVQVLFGNVRPRWGDDQPFVGGAFRGLADELIRSRFDPLLRIGAEGYEFIAPHPTLTRIFPNVHAKLYVRDDDLVAMGSANLDVTSGYWESEALMLVHDVPFARETVKALEGLLANSRRVDLKAQSWSQTESRRDWLSRNWPSLMG